MAQNKQPNVGKAKSGGKVIAVLPPPKGKFEVFVITEAGTAVEKAKVAIYFDKALVQEIATNKKGAVNFGNVVAGKYKVNVTKPGTEMVPKPANPVAPDPPGKEFTVQADISNTLTIKIKATASVTQVKATVPGTKGKRNAANKKPDNALAASTSSDTSLTSNAPVILIRGCSKVSLEAVTIPDNQPVEWSVVPNENKSSAPTITAVDAGRKAELSTDKPGSFSVIAELGLNKIIWNVVFVWVKVKPRTSTIKAQNTQYADGGSTVAFTSFKSGGFQRGQYTWHALVKLEVLGGGSDGKLGVEKTKIHILQNGLRDTLTGKYVGGGTALELPKGGIPIVDATNGTSPFIWSQLAFSVAPANDAINSNSKNREVWTGDSPAGAFLRNHRNSHTKLDTVGGVNGFETAVASTSNDAPNSIVVHAKTAWTADFSGKVDFGNPPGAVGSYTPNNPSTTKQARFQLIDEPSGGKDACDAGFEIFEPRFNGGTDTTWNP